MEVIVGKVFGRNDFSGDVPARGEYVGCTFADCNFQQADLSGFVFAECLFRGCDLSLARMEGAALREVAFEGCKMLGVRLGRCNPLGLDFSLTQCVADNTTFDALKLPKVSLKNTRLREVDFSGCDLSGATISGCDLWGATFDGTNLEGADLRTSVNYSIDPVRNRIRRAQFSLSSLPGLLDGWKIKVDTTT